MDLVDRYLHAVRTWLPARQKEDIITELADDIRSEIEEKESGLGRKLAEPELEALIKRRGRPIVAAGRYRPQQSLIGPTLFPIYTIVLKALAIPFVALWIVRWTYLAISSASFRTQPVSDLLAQSQSIFWSTGLMLFGGATLAFAILEWIQRRRPFLEDWNPRSLARVRDTRRVTRSGSITEFAVQIAFALWWIHPQAFFRLESGGRTWSAGPTWSHLHGPFFVPVLLISLATAALACVNFLRPHATRLRAGIRAGTHLAAAAVVLVVLTAHWPGFLAELAHLRGAGRPGSDVMMATMVTDVFVYLNLLGIAVGVAVAFIVEVVRMVRSGQDGAGAHGKGAEMVVGVIAPSR